MWESLGLMPRYHQTVFSFPGLEEKGPILLLFHLYCYLSKSNPGHGFPGINLKVYPENEQLEGRKKLVFD